MRRYINLVEQFLFEDAEFDTARFLERVRSVMNLVRRGGTPGERDAAKHAFDRMIARATQEIKRMRQPDSGVTPAQVDRFMQALEQIGKESKEAPREPPKAKPKPPPSMPRFKVGQWVVVANSWWSLHHVGKVKNISPWEGSFAYEVQFEDRAYGNIEEHRLRAATQDDIDAALATRAKTTSHSDTRSDGGFNIIMMARYVNPAENSNKVYGVIQKLDTGKIYTFWGGWQKPLKVKYYATEEDAHQQFRLKIRKGYEEITPGTETEAWVMRALKAEFSRIREARVWPA